MRRSRFWLLLSAAIAAALAVALGVSAAVGSFPFSRGSAGQAPESGPAGGHGASPQPALPDLSPQQLAGQRVIFSYPGLTPPPQLLTLISHGEAAGVIFFSQNVSSTAQLRQVISRLEQADASPGNPVRQPLLLMTDQEGGMVRRIPGAPLLSARQIAASADPGSAAANAGSSAAQNLRSVGMNVNLAPVLDVYRSPDDFDDQLQRSFSMDPSVVSSLGSAFIRAQQSGGVAATAKHFPGLGAAAKADNTDNQPVTVNLPAATIRNVDEAPYTAAIAAGTKLVMASWAMYPSLDPSRPAGLSRPIISGELRQRMGFTGVTITDAIEAGALRAFGGFGHRGLLAAQAGMDLLLCSAKNFSEGQQVAASLAGAYRGGQLPKAEFTAAVQRIIALRTGLAG